MKFDLEVQRRGNLAKGIKEAVKDVLDDQTVLDIYDNFMLG